MAENLEFHHEQNSNIMKEKILDEKQFNLKQIHMQTQKQLIE
jgi:hypothetical protein